MHRSSSYNRVLVLEDDNSHAPPMASHILRMASFQSSHDYDYELPRYDPISDMVMKDKPRAKFSDNAVHFIPFVLLLCAIILWFFSGAVPDVGMDKDSIMARIEGMTIEGDFDADVDGIVQTGLLPLLDTGDDELRRRSSQAMQRIQGNPESDLSRIANRMEQAAAHGESMFSICQDDRNIHTRVNEIL